MKIDLENTPIDVTDHIIKFRDFLVACWPNLNSLMQHHDWDEDGWFADDWTGLHWELLVERKLLYNKAFLTQFSFANSDMHIINPEKKPTHSILAKSSLPLVDLKTNKEIPLKSKLRLFSFCTRTKGGFGIYPPFDLADLSLDATKKLFIVPIADLRFYLTKLEEPYV